MPAHVSLSWPAKPDAAGGRGSRRAFRYQAFVPDPVARLQPALSAAAAQAVSEAERAVLELNRDPPRLASLEALARRLLRAESQASSRIEGLSLSQRRLLPPTSRVGGHWPPRVRRMPPAAESLTARRLRPPGAAARCRAMSQCRG